MPEIFLGSDRFAHDRSFFYPSFGRLPRLARSSARSCMSNTLLRLLPSQNTAFIRNPGKKAYMICAALPAASPRIRNPGEKGVSRPSGDCRALLGRSCQTCPTFGACGTLTRGASADKGRHAVRGRHVRNKRVGAWKRLRLLQTAPPQQACWHRSRSLRPLQKWVSAGRPSG